MKPYVICHLCTTIDGRILVGRWPKLPGGKNGSNLFESAADSFGIGAWLVGTDTMRAGRNVRLKKARRRIDRTGHVAGNPPRKAAAALRLKSYRKLPGGVSWFRYRVVRRSGV